jgi:ATPase subunit of ABC transporter with duplicated ATPase domains
LASLVVSSANVLLLDEPTTTSTRSREEVLAAIRTYEGGIVLVTHDEGAVQALHPDRCYPARRHRGTVEREYSELVALAYALRSVRSVEQAPLSAADTLASRRGAHQR